MSRVKIGLAAAFAAVAASSFAIEGWRTSVYEIGAWNKVATDSRTHVFSPVAFASLACLLGEGATTEVRADIAEALDLLNEFSASFATVRQAYERASESNSVSIAMAPSVWTRHPRSIDCKYVHILQNEFGAEAGVMDGIRSLNIWTETRTNGRIKDMVTRLPRSGDFIAVCGISFDGAWQNAFKDGEADKPFKLPDGTVSQVKSLCGDQPMLRLSYPRFDLAVVPLAGDEMQLMLFLPKEGEDMGAVRREALTSVAFDEVKASVRQLLHAEDGERGTSELTIPMIDLTSEFDVLPLFTDYKVPHTGFASLGQENRIGLAKLKVAVRLGASGVSLTPGRAEAEEEARLEAYERAKQLGAKTAAMHKKALEDAMKESPWAARLKPFTCDRPFFFMLWNPRSDTTVACGEFTGR